MQDLQLQLILHQIQALTRITSCIVNAILANAKSKPRVPICLEAALGFIDASSDSLVLATSPTVSGDGCNGPSVPQTSFSLIRVPSNVAARVEAAAKSIVLHQHHCQLSQENTHNPSHAALRAEQVTGSSVRTANLQVHQTANAAKHAMIYSEPDF